MERAGSGLPPLVLTLPSYSAEDALAVVRQWLGDNGFQQSVQLLDLEARTLGLTGTATSGLSKVNAPTFF